MNINSNKFKTETRLSGQPSKQMKRASLTPSNLSVEFSFKLAGTSA